MAAFAASPTSLSELPMNSSTVVSMPTEAVASHARFIELGEAKEATAILEGPSAVTEGILDSLSAVKANYNALNMQYTYELGMADSRVEIKKIYVSRKPLAKYFVKSYAHYPLLSSVMHFVTVASILLYALYRVFEVSTLNPYLLVWSIIGFGGMSVVLASASREIDESA